MIDLEGFWDFISYRPGLSATADEWRGGIGNDAWGILRDPLFAGRGVARTYTRPTDGRTLQIVPGTDGMYRLVCPVTGSLEASNLTESDVTSFGLNVTALRTMVADGLGIAADPKPVREVPLAFAVGSWEPITGENLPVFMILPPTAKLLASEASRLLVEYPKGFILLAPTRPKLSSSLRTQLERQQAVVIPLDEVLPWSRPGQLCPSPAWETYRNAYCQRHLTDRMVPAQPEYQFVRKGVWLIRFHGEETHLEGPLKGPVFIKYLLERQGQETHVARMLADIAGDERLAQASDAGEMIDKDTYEQCRQRYKELHDERAAAEKRNETDRLGDIDGEISQLASYFATCLGLRNRSRKTQDDISKIRKRIARVIETAYEKIAENDPPLAAHLRNSIKTHTYMSYQPETRIDWIF